MQPGDSLGKITKLRYIDDINDDELILYVFEDGTKCDEQYIAEINNTQAFGKFVMAELTNPLNKWEFKVNEFNLSKPKFVTGDDGQRYEVPDPGISITRDNNNYVEGSHTFVSTSEDGIMKPQTMPFDGKRIEAIPPRNVKNKNVEPKENYLLSLHPELLNGPINEDNQISAELLSHSVQKQEQIQPKILNKSNIMSSKSPITTNVIETVKHASIVIDLDELTKSKEYDSVKLIINGEDQEFTIDEFIEKLKNFNNVSEPAIISMPIENAVSQHPTYKEDIFITNMIDKSKKKNCTIGVDFNLDLPPKEVYNMIKTVYSDELASEFVRSLAHRMNIEELKSAVSMGLENYYDTETATNKKQ